MYLKREGFDDGAHALPTYAHILDPFGDTNILFVPIDVWP